MRYVCILSISPAVNMWYVSVFYQYHLLSIPDTSLYFINITCCQYLVRLCILSISPAVNSWYVSVFYQYHLLSICDTSLYSINITRCQYAIHLCILSYHLLSICDTSLYSVNITCCGKDALKPGVGTHASCQPSPSQCIPFVVSPMWEVLYKHFVNVTQLSIYPQGVY